MGMNDFQIGLVGKLDDTQSKQQINSDINALKKQLNNVEIQAKLGKDVVSNLTKQLNATQISLQNVSIDKNAINNMISQINTALNGININIGNNINSNGLVQNAQRTGQQIGQIISNEAQRAISNVSSNNIGRYFRITPSTSNQFHSEMEKLVSKWTNGKGKLTDIKVDTRTTYDNDAQANIERLHQATVTYKNDLDEIIKKTIAWRQIGTSTDAQGNETPIRGFVEVAGQYSKSLDIINQKTDTFVEKQKTAVAKAQNTLNSIKSGLTDKGANRTLANTDFDANGLTAAISKADNAINTLGNSTKATFTDANNEVTTAISELNDLITRLKNAEYTATSLRTKDINTIKIDENNKLDAFVEKMKQSGHYTDELKAEVSILKNTLNSVFDANSLTNYLNEMSNLESKFKLVDAQAKTLEKDTKLQTNIESEKKQLQVYTNELKQVGVMSNEVKDKIQQMFYSLSKVDTQTGLTTWRAELKGVKAETDEVLKSVQKLSVTSIPKAKFEKITNGGYGIDLDKLVSEFQKINAYSDTTQEKINSLRQTLASMQTMSGSELVSTFNNFETEVGKLKVQLDQAKLSFDKFAQPISDEKVTSLLLRIQNFMSKNTAITKEAKTQLELYIKELSGGNVPLGRWNQINQALAKTESEMRTLGKLGKSLKDQFRQAAESFTQWISVSSAVMLGVTKFKNAISELKDIDDILTEISKTSNLTANQLKGLGSIAFDSASKYGKSASDYLTGVQEMYRAGFDNAPEMSELSILAQSAGDMTSDAANDYLIATNAAYDYKNSVEELNSVLDSQNYITNNAAISMQDMTDATSESASVAAQYGVKIEELSALIATVVSKTRESGSEAGNALKSLFITLQDTTSKPVQEAFEAVGISMTKMVDGAERLKTPIELLKELSVAFNSLPEGDTKRANILTDIGKKYHANDLAAILSDWKSYEKMLDLYNSDSANGSALEEAEKSANNLSGSLAKLSNTGSSTINNIVNSNELKSGVNILNIILTGVNKLTSALGSLGTVGVGAGLIQSLTGHGEIVLRPSF